MKALAFSSLLLLSGWTAFGQNPSEPADKAPPAVDEALRARITKFYDAFVSGKFKDAYVLVADDSQDQFFEMAKMQYKSCEIAKVDYSANFTKAAVVTNCKGDWRWHGHVTVTTIPVASNWVVIDSQWNWHYEKPTTVPSPFSPTGVVQIPPDSSTEKAPSLVPKDIAAVARGILAKVGLDKQNVQLRAYENSQDVLHVRNDMPGDVSIRLDKVTVPGLKVSVGKTDLKAHEETSILFEWRLDDPAIQCLECAKKMNGRLTVQLHVAPTNQVFSIGVLLVNAPPVVQTPAPAK
jgi:hypothetical protein